MKKTLTMFLVFAMAFSMTACAGTKDAKTIYNEATKKTSELTSMDVISTVNTQMTQGENKTEMKVNLDMKIADINKETMKYSATGTTSVMGQDLDISMYYENGYYYMASMGQKIKYAMDIKEMMEQVKQSTEGASLDASYMKEISAQKDGDNQIITFTVDSQKMDSYVKDLISQMGTNLEGVTYNIKEVKGEATVNKDGYFSKSKINMSLDMTAQGETITMVMDTDAAYNNPGQTVEVTAPDLEGYTEVDPSTMESK